MTKLKKPPPLPNNFFTFIPYFSVVKSTEHVILQSHVILQTSHLQTSLAYLIAFGGQVLGGSVDAVVEVEHQDERRPVVSDIHAHVQVGVRHELDIALVWPQDAALTREPGVPEYGEGEQHTWSLPVKVKIIFWSLDRFRAWGPLCP